MDSEGGVQLDGSAVKEPRKPPKISFAEQPPAPLDRGCLSQPKNPLISNQTPVPFLAISLDKNNRFWFNMVTRRFNIAKQYLEND